MEIQKLISESNRGKGQIIIDRKFKYNFSKLKRQYKIMILHIIILVMKLMHPNH